MKSDSAKPWWHPSVWIPEGTTQRQVVGYGAVLLIGGQLLLRGWAVFGAWFYSDDFIFLGDLDRRSLSWHVLFTPHDSHLMPLGMTIAWVVAHAGAYNWALAATITLTLQCAASAACLLMLTTVFGWKVRVLGPLALYLFATLSIDGFLWWSAALNALPLHIGFFLAVTGAVRYFRSRSMLALALALSGLTIGLLADPRGMLVPVTVGLLASWFFATGPAWQRPFVALRRWWRLWVPCAIVLAVYFIAYTRLVPSPVSTKGHIEVAATANTMIGTSFVTAVLGGPWRWDGVNPPMGFVDPPMILRYVAIVGLLALVGTQLRRAPLPTLGALTILTTHLAITLGGAVFGRATQIGPVAGLLMRFLADVAPVATLAVALATLPMPNSACPVPSHRGSTRVAASSALAGLAVLALVGAVFSTIQFARPWHSYPARDFVANARASLARDPAVIADVEVPELVQAATSYPNNLPSRLLAPLHGLRTSTAGNDLRVLDKRGFHRQAEVPAFIASRPGPRANCGYPITSAATTITLPSRNNAAFWWTTFSYVAGAPAQVEVRVDHRLVTVIDIQPGAHTYFLQGENPFTDVTLRATLPGTGACVDKITVGDSIVPSR